MVNMKLPAMHAVACAVLFLGNTVYAQSFTGHDKAMQVRMDALTQELADQRQLLANLETFRKQYVEQRALLESLERQVAQQQQKRLCSWHKPRRCKPRKLPRHSR